MEDSVNNVNRQRQSLCCISVPALNSWVKQCLVTDKHQHSACQPLQHKNKRPHPDECASTGEMLFTPGTSVKRFCFSNQCVSSNASHNIELNLPLPESGAKICLIKVRNFRSVHSVITN